MPSDGYLGSVPSSLGTDETVEALPLASPRALAVDVAGVSNPAFRKEFWMALFVATFQDAESIKNITRTIIMKMTWKHLTAITDLWCVLS